MRGKPIFSTIFLVINLAVFALWSFGGDENSEWIRANFTVSYNGLLEGRYWTLLTSVFSHNMLLHLLVNMLVLRSFGSILEEFLGSWRFLRFYLVAGILSSLAHALISNFVMHTPDVAALGASGALAGCVLVFSLLFPKEKILLFGIIPLPAIFGAFAFIALDLWGLYAQAGGGGLPIGHGAHLGGAFAGILYYLLKLRPALKRRTT